MPVKVIANDLPKALRRSVAGSITAVLPVNGEEWTVAMTSDAVNRAWDIEIRGPGSFEWSRRFSGADRDGEVIAEAIRSAIEPQSSPGIHEALSSLAIQGIAFISDTGKDGKLEYVVDRVRLKESEILYLHKQGALTVDGIRKYLLNRHAA
jgi:hypothetical protein